MNDDRTREQVPGQVQEMTRRDFLGAAAGTAIAVFLMQIPGAEGSSEPRTYAYIIDATQCIGCGNCVRACARENDVPEGCYRTWVERYTVTSSGDLIVESPDGGKHGFGEPPVPEADVRKAFFVPKMCNHCAKPPCVQVCPVGATFKVEDGAVLVDSERCMGCGYCVQSCPYGARFINPDTHTADKCTWCYHRVTRGLLPACVTVCPVGARRFGEVREGSEMSELLLRERLDVLKGDLGTEPRVYYQGLSREVR